MADAAERGSSSSSCSCCCLEDCVRSIERTLRAAGIKVHHAGRNALQKLSVRFAWTLIFCFILVLAYYLALKDVYDGRAPLVATIVFSVWVTSGVFMCIVVACEKCIKRHSDEAFVLRIWLGSFAMIFVWAMIFQFQVYLAMIAWKYPYICELAAVTDPTANITVYLGGRTSAHTVGKSTVQKAGGFDWDVECNDRVKVLGIRGGRETVALLSHAVPFIFACMYAVAIGSRLGISFNRMVLDFIDLQDFYSMLLDNNMILGYWGRADVSDPHGNTYGGEIIWQVVFWWFIGASIYVCTFPILKVLSAQSAQTAETRTKQAATAPPAPRTLVEGELREAAAARPRPSAPVAGKLVEAAPVQGELLEAPALTYGKPHEAAPVKGEVHEEDVKVSIATHEGRHCCHGWNPSGIKRVEAFFSLMTIEIPFFVIRLFCSVRMRMVASNLLAKNFFAGCYDVGRLWSGEDQKRTGKRASRQFMVSSRVLDGALEAVHDFAGFFGQEKPDSATEVAGVTAVAAATFPSLHADKIGAG
eukprot:TRINITY_DN33620_c0_g1_i3.p1 TRINITY_DN33620_c0_g1~~TRINITY_DN33620_c0_g1_i3.p1  ORF type:complete len:530 (+),score=81.70 TRINITY_DN33620_c0_g1_i3:44-1633(+)